MSELLALKSAPGIALSLALLVGLAGIGVGQLYAFTRPALASGVSSPDLDRRPPLDREVPKSLETATFALG